MKRTIFSDYELYNKIDIKTMTYNFPAGHEKIKEPITFFSVNPLNFDDYCDNNVYYVCKDKGKILKITKEEIRKEIESGKIDSTYYEYSKIPGIEIENKSERKA